MIYNLIMIAKRENLFPLEIYDELEEKIINILNCQEKLKLSLISKKYKSVLYQKHRFKPKNKAELIHMVNLWCDSETQKNVIKKKGHISTWDISLVTDISYLFYYKINFNDDISNWNTSNVTNMRGTFMGCKIFNQALNKWNVSNVNDMAYMFCQT